MIKFVGMASEHTTIPESLMDKSEFRKNNQTPDYLRYSYDPSTNKNVDNGKYSVYCTYAWIKTDEIEVHNDYDDEIPVAVMDYKPKYSKRTQFVFEEPVWHWIEDLRTADEQRWISKNIDKLNEIFKDFANIENS